MIEAPLSPIDCVFTGAGSQPVTFAFYYSSGLDANRLSTSLDETLDRFPLLRSILCRISETDFVFRTSDEGLQFDSVHSKENFERSRSIASYIKPVDSVEGEPLTRITHTRIPKGSVLAVSISHALVDGFSFFHFLSSWARIARGDRILEPVFDRSLFSSGTWTVPESVSPEDVYRESGLFLNGRRTAGKMQLLEERFFMSDEEIRSQCEEVRKGAEVSCTENDVITAMLWEKYLLEWNRSEGNSETYMTCPFDFRRALSGFPKMYFGCALCFVSASVSMSTLASASRRDLAILIRKAVSRMKNEAILRSLGTLQGLRRTRGLSAMEEIHLRHPQHGMIVTNLTRLPIRDLDFGSGIPADFSTFAEVSGSAAILPAENGVEILVVHPQKEMIDG